MLVCLRKEQIHPSVSFQVLSISFYPGADILEVEDCRAAAVPDPSSFPRLPLAPKLMLQNLQLLLAELERRLDSLAPSPGPGHPLTGTASMAHDYLSGQKEIGELAKQVLFPPQLCAFGMHS